MCIRDRHMYMYGQTDGNPMIEPVRLPALRVYDGRALEELGTMIKHYNLICMKKLGNK